MRGIFKNLHRYLLWLVVSIFFWAWIFTLITDAPAARKVTLFADLPAMERGELSAALEANMPETIRFVEARLFTDELFQPANVLMGDMFIVSEAQAADYLSTFSPLDAAAFADSPLYASEGVAYGVCVFDEGTGICAGTRYVSYLPGTRYYLFFNAESRHLGAWNGSRDDAAIRAARTFLSLP